MLDKPRLRTVLVLLNLVILVLPLSGIGVLRIYESALVRQTESELIAQSAFIAAAYESAFERAWANRADRRLRLSAYGKSAPVDGASDEESRWRPRPPVLDLATDTIYPPAEDGMPATMDALAKRAGQELTSLIKKAQITTLASIRVLDFNGVVVSSTGEELGHSLAQREEVEFALRGEPISLMRQRIPDKPIPTLSRISRNTGVRVFVTTPIIVNNRIIGVVSLSRTPKNIWQAFNEKRTILIYTSVVLLLIVIAVSLITSLKIGRPIHALIDQAEAAALGEKGAISMLEHPGTWEIERLSRAVSTMATNLEKRAEYIRDFAAHVSHEFKTPLTSIQGALELLTDHGDTMSPTDREKFLANLVQDSRRLERLVAALLELARADTLAHRGTSTQLGTTLAPLVERYRQEGVDIVLESAAGQDPVIAMDGDNLVTIFTNLVDNARQHGGDRVAIRIDIGRVDDSGMVEIAFSDNGPGISAANAQKVFEPFFTSARNSGGTGLGLSIIRALVNSHHGLVSLDPASAGCRFRVTLPTAPPGK